MRGQSKSHAPVNSLQVSYTRIHVGRTTYRSQEWNSSARLYRSAPNLMAPRATVRNKLARLPSVLTHAMELHAAYILRTQAQCHTQKHRHPVVSFLSEHTKLKPAHREVQIYPSICSFGLACKAIFLATNTHQLRQHILLEP
jgi:hypothetical protein